MKMIVSVACGVLSLNLMFLALWPAWGVFPPPPATFTAAEMAEKFRDNSLGMIVGGILMSFGLSLLFVFLGGLVDCLRKMEGRSSALTDAVVMISPFVYFTVMVTTVFFITAGFHPDTSNEMFRFIADVGFLMMVFPAAPGFVMFVVTGLIILGDVNAEPIFPRWVGYLSVWTGILSLPGFACALLKTGPFAWNGILAFWLPVVVFGIILMVIMWAMLRARTHPAMITR